MLQSRNKSLSALVFDLIELDIDAPENSALVERIKGELADKVDNYSSFLSEVDSRKQFLKQEVDFLNKQVKALDKVENRLHDLALFSLKTLGTDKLKSDLGHSISLRKSVSVEVTDQSLLPESYLRTKVTVEPDKAALKEVLKTGEVVEGAQLVEKEYVVIK